MVNMFGQKSGKNLTGRCNVSLKDIWEVEKDANLHKEYREIYENLIKKHNVKHGYDLRKLLIENHNNNSSYARNTHTGRIKDGVELTELELSMVCDNGFSHFGGSSTIRTDRTFTVVIYTD
jgi:hypothetical protein